MAALRYLSYINQFCINVLILYRNWPSFGARCDREAVEPVRQDIEWGDLTAFATGPGPRLRLGILYDARRYGKTYLLRRLVESVGGVYHLALQEERRSALDRFAVTLSQLQTGTPPLRF